MPARRSPAMSPAAALAMLIRACNVREPDPLVMFAAIEKAKHALAARRRRPTPKRL